VKKLAGAPAHRATLEKLRARLDRWMVETKDRGPESAEMYYSDMAVYVEGRTRKGDDAAVTRNNIALTKQWAKAGK